MPFLPFIPFTDTADVVVQGLMGGVDAFLTFAVKKAGAFAGTDLQDIADLVAGWVTADLSPQQTSDTTIQAIKVTDLTTSSSPVAFSTLGLPSVGAVGGHPSSNQVALVMSFQTALRGRSYRGRNYVFGIPDNLLSTTTTWNATILTNMTTAYAALFGALASAGFQHVVLSRYADSVRRTVGVATPVTSIVAKALVGTQRKRLV